MGSDTGLGCVVLLVIYAVAFCVSTAFIKFLAWLVSLAFTGFHGFTWLQAAVVAFIFGMVTQAIRSWRD